MHHAELPEPTRPLRRDLVLLCALASTLLALHFLMGNGYGFHRDELQFLDDARHLGWGFAAYPPLTAFSGRLAIGLFGISPGVFRLPAALVNACTLVLAGLMARQLGGRRFAQVTAVCAAFPVALLFSSVLQYNTFDFLAWNLILVFTLSVLRTGNSRFWLGAGVGVGLGVLSKYSVAMPVAALLLGLVLLPSQRHHLRSRWFWAAALVAAAIAAPNLLWLARHHFLTLQMEHSIHTRDVRLGRADGFYPDQVKFTLLAFPLAVAGLISLLRSARYRLLSLVYLGTFALLVLAKGRGYYLLPGYPVLYAAGAVALERVLASRGQAWKASAAALVLAATLVDAGLAAWTYLPIWPAGSAAWNWQMRNNEDMANEIGWPEFVAQVAAVRDTLPAADRGRLGVLANNFGEAGALELYGPQYGLPTPISSVNGFHDRGWGPYDPETVIVVGGELNDQRSNFATCSVAAIVHLPYGVRNEESVDHPQILICHHLRQPWPAVWAHSQEFG